MAVNARGPMLLCKHAIPHMIAAGGGSIIHSSSGFGTLGESTLTAYGASKAALINLSRFIATQYGRQKIRSNVIVIGFVLTPNAIRSEEHTSELQPLMRNSYAVLVLKKKK